MTIPPFLGEPNAHSLWEDLGHGAPTMMALAKLCSEAIGRPPQPLDSISPEAACLLYLARDRGAFEVKATDKAFDALDRFLTVHVETADDELLPMKIRGDAEATSRLFAGFVELCAAGLVMHHILRDFSLTAQGFERAKRITQDDVAALLSRIGTAASDHP